MDIIRLYGYKNKERVKRIFLNVSCDGYTDIRLIKRVKGIING